MQPLRRHHHPGPNCREFLLAQENSGHRDLLPDMPDVSAAWAPKEKCDSTTDYQVRTIGHDGTGFSRADYSMMPENWSQVHANHSRLLHAIYLGQAVQGRRRPTHCG